jgi:hypothetical protein
MTEQKTYATRVRRAAYLDVDTVPTLATADDDASNTEVRSRSRDGRSSIVSSHGICGATPPLPTPLTCGNAPSC